MHTTYQFAEIARLTRPGDNVAIATQLLDAGTKITFEDTTLTLSHTILEGHRLL